MSTLRKQNVYLGSGFCYVWTLVNSGKQRPIRGWLNGGGSIVMVGSPISGKLHISIGWV